MAISKSNLSLGNLGARQLVRSQQQGDLIIPDIRRETLLLKNSSSRKVRKGNCGINNETSELLKQVVDQLIRSPVVSFLMSTISHDLNSNPNLLKTLTERYIKAILLRHSSENSSRQL